MNRLLALGLGLLLAVTGCKKSTGELSPALLTRFGGEGIVHRADDIEFRRTNVGEGSAATWEEKRASIVVTKQSVFLHINGKPLVEITPRSTGLYEVHRDHDRIALHAGSGKSATSWSFRPPTTAAESSEAWTDDIRAVIKLATPRSDYVEQQQNRKKGK